MTQDLLYSDAEQLARRVGYVDTSMIQRRLKVPYMRAAVILDQLERGGVVAVKQGNRYKEVII